MIALLCFVLTLYAFIIVRLARRDLVWINVTINPSADWIARQITEAFPWNEAPLYLIHDRDQVYGVAVRHRLRAMGTRDKPIAPFAERLIGSIRRERVDHMLCWARRTCVECQNPMPDIIMK